MASVLDIIAIVPTIADNGPAVLDALNGQTTGTIATPGLAGGNIIASFAGPLVSLPVNAQLQAFLGGFTLIKISTILAHGGSIDDIGVGDVIQIVSGGVIVTAGIAFVTAGVVTSGTLLGVLGVTAAVGQLAANQFNISLRDLMSSLTFDWIAATNVSSPLILDLDGDGVETLGLGALVNFDHAGDGFGERTGWVGKDDGLLVRDLNGDGKITSGAELFGNKTRLSNGNNAANGFLALAELDSNSDGKIDSNDAAWSSLQVWKDTNSDGVTDASELLTLSQAGVGEIGLSYVNQGSGVAPDASGNLHQQVGGYVTASGGSRAMTDVWFTTSNWDTLDQRTPLTLSTDITALPDLPGLGNLGSLRQAMARDSSGALKAAVSAFGTASSANQRSTLLHEVMFRWAGVFDLDPASRGNAIGDARILAFLEAVFVQNFQQNGGANNNPGGGAVPILQNIFTQLSSNFAAQMDLQGRDKLFYETINLEWNDSQQSFEIDADALEVFVRQQYAAGASSAIFELKRFGANILALGSEELLKAISATGSFHGDEVDRTLFWLGQKLGNENSESIYGISGVSNRINALGGNDQINGAELNDMLDGGEGNDNIWGNAGNDTLSGGLGNDYLSGDSGDDTYLFNLGDGNDIIAEYSNQGIDTLNLGSGITTSNVQIARTGNSFSDLVLSFGGTDSITIRDYFYGNSNAGRIENIVFTDGTVWDFAALTSRLTTQGTANGDYLYGISGVSNRINGLGGGDNINGAELNDVLDGGEGNDNIWGNAGNDTLSGGLGNDYLSGDSGDDTYLFNLGDGNDIIAEYSNQGIDTLNLGSGITTSNVQIARTGNSFSDLVLSFGGTDSITIRDYFYGNSNAGRIENIVFTDGTVWDFAALTSRLTTQGTANGDYLYGISGVSNRINGLGGGDNINGAELNDVLDGGEGNDSIWGNAGNDTLSGGLGNDYLSGDAGDDSYLFNLGDGNDTISDYDNTSGNIDTAFFGVGIAADQVWLQQVGNNLEVSIIGRNDKLVINNWYLGNSYHVERFRTSDGLTLRDDRVQNLVQAMASFSPPATGQTTLPSNYQSSLASVIAANWQ